MFRRRCDHGLTCVRRGRGDAFGASRTPDRGWIERSPCHLQERAQQREEALKKSEQMLEEDALRFDQFLKDNDAKAVQAIKKAEAETKVSARDAVRGEPCGGGLCCAAHP